MRQILDNPWFSGAELALVTLCALLWYAAPGVVTWQLLPVALLPALFRLAAGRSPWPRTPLDIPLLLFFLTAVTGVWVAYNREMAAAKLWIIVGAILVYYALASQSSPHGWRLAGFSGLLAAAVAIYFLFSHDWQLWQADADLLDRASSWWVAARPFTFPARLHPNVAGGLMAMLAPLQLAFVFIAWRRQKWFWSGVAGLIGGITLGGFAFTSSRAAFLALAVGLGIWLLWGLGYRGGRILQVRREHFFAASLVLLLVGGAWMSYTLYGGLLQLMAQLPGVDSTVGRAQLAEHTWLLIQDFPYTGGGLASFAGLYSHYVMVTPFFLFDYSHNFFLDVALEQGYAGLLSLLLILAGATWLLIRFPWSLKDLSPVERPFLAQSPDSSVVRWGLAASLVVIILHGLVDNALYGMLGTPFLFWIPGLVMVVARQEGIVRQNDATTLLSRRLGGALAAAAVMVLGALAIHFRQPLAANWYANLGAAQMAQIELSDWPTNEWDDGRNASALLAAAPWFEQALLADPTNRTARHRLGLIAMLERDYETAVRHLELASRADPRHRGIQKSLGYSYVWQGMPDRAIPWLVYIAEAPQEMETYVWWWGRHNRHDLAAQAATMSQRLK